MIGRLHHVVIDCPGPQTLAAFYAELTGLPITWQDPDFVVIARSDTSSDIAFQRVPTTSHRSGPIRTVRNSTSATG